jgi:hypothetical protein
MRFQIPARAYHGGRGWAYAKLVRHASRAKALCLYVTALAHGCYTPRMGAIVLLQILLGEARYRRFADFAIARLGVGLREKTHPQPKQRSAMA